MRMRKVIMSIVLLCFSSPTWAAINDGLVAYFPFNGNANDESGNNYRASPFSASLTSDRNGQESSAYYLNFGFIETNVDGTQFLNSMSYSLWFKNNLRDYYNNTGALPVVISIGSYNFSLNYYRSYRDNKINSVSGGEFVVDLRDNRWHHIAVSYDNKSLVVYVDGLKFYQTTLSEPFSFSGDHFRFGKHTSGSKPDFVGYIDDVRIYNRSLNENDAYELYSGTPPAPTPSDDYKLSKLVNISTRAQVLGGEDDVFASFVVQGNDNIPLIIRGVGLDGTDTKLTLVKITDPSIPVIMETNDNWIDSSKYAEMQALSPHLQPQKDTDAGIYVQLPQGVYSAVMGSATNSGRGVVSVDALR